MDPDIELFHTGWSVDSLASAMADLTTAQGVTWRPVVESLDMKVRVRGSVLSAYVRRVYTVEGPHHLELLEGDPRIWGPDGPLRGMHLGYWTTDLVHDVGRLLDAGAELVMSDAPPDGGFERFAILRMGGGTVVELLPVARRDEILNS